MPPRAVLISSAERFISVIASASIRLRVASFRGVCTVTTSEARSSSSIGVLGRAPSGIPSASWAITRMPNPQAMRATPRPIAPKPMMPIVLPCSSKVG